MEFLWPQKIFTKTLMIFSTLDNGGYLNFYFLFYFKKGPDGNPPKHNRERGFFSSSPFD